MKGGAWPTTCGQTAARPVSCRASPACCPRAGCPRACVRPSGPLPGPRPEGGPDGPLRRRGGRRDHGRRYGSRCCGQVRKLGGGSQGGRPMSSIAGPAPGPCPRAGTPAGTRGSTTSWIRGRTGPSTTGTLTLTNPGRRPASGSPPATPWSPARAGPHSPPAPSPALAGPDSPPRPRRTAGRSPYRWRGFKAVAETTRTVRIRAYTPRPSSPFGDAVRGL